MTLPRLTAVAALTGLLITAGACASSPGTGQAGNYLESTRWYVLSVDGQGVPQAVEEAPFIIADPYSGRLQGHAGCNNFNGPYRAGGSEVAFGPFAMTRKACPGIGDWESRLTDAIMAADGYRVEDNRLVLMEAGQVRVRLQAAGS